MTFTAQKIRMEVQNRKAAAALVEGKSATEAAQLAGISPRQLRRRVKSEEFQILLDAAEPTAGTDLAYRISYSRLKAVKKLIRLLDSGDARVQFAAASKILRLSDQSLEELRRGKPKPLPLPNAPPPPPAELSVAELMAILEGRNEQVSAGQ